MASLLMREALRILSGGPYFTRLARSGMAYLGLARSLSVLAGSALGTVCMMTLSRPPRTAVSRSLG